MKKQLSILCVSAGVLLSGCSHMCEEGCPIGSCSKSSCMMEKEVVAPAVVRVDSEATSYFALNSAVLSAQDKHALNAVVAHMKNHPEQKVRLNGYTDNTGPEAYNMTLSKERADAVAEYLMDQGISSDRISTRGYGPQNFAQANTNMSGRAKNRRTEVVFY